MAFDIFAQRLSVLEQHIRNGKLNHTQFSMTNFSKKTNFGNAGCALAECPFLFSEHWEFEEVKNQKNVYWPKLVGTKFNPISSAITYFNLKWDEVYHLFNPYSQNIKKFGGNRINSTSGRTMFANNLKEFMVKTGRS